MGHDTHEAATRLLMSQIEESRAKVSWVGLEIEQIVDLVGRWHTPSFEFIVDKECRKHSMPVRRNFEGADIQIVCLFSEVTM